MEISISNIRAVFIKQCKDIFKEVQIMILFIVYPLIAVAMKSVMGAQFGQTNFFIAIFAVMHVIFTPMVAAASVIAEEKEKNTLRVLIMSGVRPIEYLIGIGSFVFLSTLLTGASFLVMGTYTLRTGTAVLLYISVGCVCSILLGLSIGGLSHGMTSANATAVPVGLALSFLPMFSSFNEKLMRASHYLYGQQIADFIQNPESNKMTGESVLIVFFNILFCTVAFFIIFRHNRIDK